MIRYDLSSIFIVITIVDSFYSSKYISSSDISYTKFLNLLFIITIVWVRDVEFEFNKKYY